MSARICIPMRVVNSADGVDVYLEGTNNAKSVILYRNVSGSWEQILVVDP